MLLMNLLWDIADHLNHGDDQRARARPSERRPTQAAYN